MNQNQITIIGGGLSGLIAAYLLAKNGKEVLLIEKRATPFTGFAENISPMK